MGVKAALVAAAGLIAVGVGFVFWPAALIVAGIEVAALTVLFGFEVGE